MFAGVSTHLVEYHPKAVAGLQRAAELAAVREAECGALVAVLDARRSRSWSGLSLCNSADPAWSE